LLDQSGYLDFQVDVELAGSGAKEEGAESGRNDSELKVLPPWMVKEGMNLTKEQRGETSITSNGDEKSEGKDVKKQDPKEDEKSIQVSQLRIEHRLYLLLKEVLH
jgi:transcription initiation factor TFIIE subunit alpha